MGTTTFEGELVQDSGVEAGRLITDIFDDTASRESAHDAPIDLAAEAAAIGDLATGQVVAEPRLKPVVESPLMGGRAYEVGPNARPNGWGGMPRRIGAVAFMRVLAVHRL